MDTRSAAPTIATPSPGGSLEDWMTATNVFAAIEHTRRRCGGKTAVTFIASDPDAPARQDCTRRLLLEVLQSDPIAALAVHEERGRGQVVCMELTTADQVSAREARRRIAAALLLALEWTTPSPVTLGAAQ